MTELMRFMNRTKVNRRRAIALAVAPVGFAFLRAPVAAQDDPAVTLLNQAAAKMAELTSFRFELSTISGESTILQNLELVGAEGAVVRPDRFEATITAKVAIVEVDVSVLGIGDRLWVTDPTTGGSEYVEVTGGLEQAPDETRILPDLINPDRILLEAVRYIRDPKIDGREKIDGVETTRVTGIFGIAELFSSRGGTPEAGNELLILEELPVLIWVNASGYVLRIEIEGPIFSSESPNVIRRLDLFDFDEPVDIQEPEGATTS